MGHDSSLVDETIALQGNDYPSNIQMQLRTEISWISITWDATVRMIEYFKEYFSMVGFKESYWKELSLMIVESYICHLLSKILYSLNCIKFSISTLWNFCWKALIDGPWLVPRGWDYITREWLSHQYSNATKDRGFMNLDYLMLQSGWYNIFKNTLQWLDLKKVTEKS